MSKINITAVIAALLLTGNPSTGLADPQKDYEIAVTRGTYQIENGEYEAAITSLKQALAARPQDKAATVSLGIANARSGNLDEARNILLDALALDKADGRTQYELGVVCYQLKDMECAEAQFSSAAESGAEEHIRQAATVYLDRIAAAGEEGQRGKTAFSVLAGLQYDSNVILEPSVPIVDGEKESDWRVIASLSARLPFLQTETKAVDAGYQLYQSLHAMLEDFNVRRHAVDIAGRAVLSASVKAALQYQYGYTSVGESRYSSIHRISPAATFTHSPTNSTELTYAREIKNYYESDMFIANSERDGSNEAIGVTHKAVLSRGLDLVFGYVYDRDITDADWWEYRGQKGFAEIRANTSGVNLILSASFNDRKYDNLSPGFTEKRHDQYYEYSFHLIRSFSRNISLDLSDQYSSNRSNLGPYDYTRNIIGLFAVVAL